MEIKLNVGILLVLCFIWAGLTWAEPSAALDPNAEATRSLAQL